MVVMIAGSGRSGSTLVGRLLGEFADSVAVGEVYRLWESGFERNELCGCGREFSRCPFWRSAIDRFRSELDVDPGSIRSLRDEALRWRSVLDLRLGRGPSQALRLYVDVVDTLYRSVAAESGARVIIDSSKFPLYVSAITAGSSLEVGMVHLVRDPRGVAYSLQRPTRRVDVHWTTEYMPQTAAWRSALLWLKRNAQTEVMRSLASTRAFCRYEDLMADPARVARQVRAELCLAPEAPSFLASGTAHLQATHAIAGNPRRLERGNIPLEADEEWRRLLPRRQAQVVGLLTLPLLGRYGYRYRGAGRRGRREQR